MKHILILVCLFPLIFAKCDDENTCMCNNITLEHYEPNGGWSYTFDPDGRLFYSEGPGCTRNLTCQLSSQTYFVAGWEDTEIPKRNSAPYSGFSIPANDMDVEKTGIYVDLQELFGIVCENSKWYITKYPYGISYLSAEVAESVNVKASNLACKPYKTAVRKFYCDGEPYNILGL